MPRTTSVATGSGLGKGLSYDITVPVYLTQAEFWLQFTDTQTLGFYVYSCPTEYGTYNQIWAFSSTVTGTGAAWYSTGSINVPMNVGTHYIVAVSWSGTMTYFFGTGDSQPTTFGSETNAYAAGTHPMGPTISSLGNDIAIYHQRLTTFPQNPPGWQVNSAEASFDIDGAQLTNPYVQTGAQVTTSPYGFSTAANFVMETCNFDVSSLSSFTLNFSLSRIGATVGTLIIWQDDGGLGTFSTQLATYSGADPNQLQGGTEWSQESIPFVPTTAAVAFRFDYIAGGNFTGDIAIDDFSVQ